MKINFIEQDFFFFIVYFLYYNEVNLDIGKENVSSNSSNDLESLLNLDSSLLGELSSELNSKNMEELILFKTTIIIFFNNLEFALTSILTQIEKDYKNIMCVYVGIGQKQSTIAHMYGILQNYNSTKNIVLLTSSASASAAEQYIAPYAGTAIAEVYRDFGLSTLIVYDDLSKHAAAYRQLSLLLRRPPGREAYPGDVFYLHSRLIERSAKLSEEKSSGGSLTSLPVIETQAGDLAGYIPTNVISITDGQIFLSKELFLTGFIPAVHIGLSVSRVGSAAQPLSLKKVAGRLKLILSQYYDVESLAQIDYELDAAMQLILTRGSQLLAVLKQPQYRPVSVNLQILAIFMVTNGYLDQIDSEYNLVGIRSSFHFYKVLNLLYENSFKNFSNSTKELLNECPKYLLTKYSFGYWKSLQIINYFVTSKESKVLLFSFNYYNMHISTDKFSIWYKKLFLNLLSSMKKL